MQGHTDKSCQITLFGSVQQFEAIERVRTWLAGHHLTMEDLIWRSPSSAKNTAQICVQCHVYGSCTVLAQVRAEVRPLADELGIDIVMQNVSTAQRDIRLAVFDMDSTLIKAEVIDELAAEAGIGAKVAAITAQAMAGAIDFKESFRQRLALLKGLDESALERIHARLELMDGAEALLTELHQRQCKTAIISGGFTWFAERLQQRLGIDKVFANTLAIKNGKVTGEVEGTVVDTHQKALLLQALAQEQGIPLEQVLAVGDGANDLEMLATAGLGIAFHGKPLVRERARYAISTQGLDAIIHLLPEHVA